MILSGVGRGQILFLFYLSFFHLKLEQLVAHCNILEYSILRNRSSILRHLHAHDSEVFRRG
jgi:hypothetical protein